MTFAGRRALWIAALATACLMFLVVWRPLGDATVHNVIVTVSLIIASTALIAAALSVDTDGGWLVVGVNALLIGFLVRSMPALVLEHPPLHDGYFYLVSLLNVSQAGSLEPAYGSWYSQVGQQLDWPILQLLSAQVTSWTGVSPVELSRFLPAALGSLTYFAVGLLAHQAFGSWRVAAVAGVLGGFADPAMYYQSEYQPQGLAILSVLLFLYLVVASRSQERTSVRVLMLMVGGALLFTHHASTLMLPLIVGPLLVVPVLARFLARGRAGLNAGIAGTLADGLVGLTPYVSIAVLLIVASAALHTYYSDSIARVVLSGLDPTALFAPRGSSTAPELWFSALRASKYVLFSLGLIGVWRCLRSPARNQLLLVLLTMGLFAGTGLSLALFPGGAVRFLAITIPVAATFAAYALANAVGVGNLSRRIVQIGATALGGLYIALATANSQSTSLGYLLVDPPRSAGAWYGGALPRTDLTALAGDWIRQTDNPDMIYAVDFSTRMAPFYYGRISDTRVVVGGTDAKSYCKANALVVDYLLAREGLMEPRLSFNYADYARVYDNGAVAVFLRPGGDC